jgi:hypothetical protein
MAITIPVETDENISLEEFLYDVEHTLDVNDESTLVALAPRLRRLANNRQFLAQFINDELAAWESFQGDSAYTAQVFQLAVARHYLVRANVWEPPRPSQKDSASLDSLFMYQQPHDHNFSFLTVGYLGPGYQTTIFECEPASITGIPGDKVDMTFSETTTLPEGKVMLYRAERDIHRQEYPAEYSMSLNLLVIPGEQRLREQHYFDLETKTIVASMKASPAHPRLNCYLARFVGDPATRTKLDNIRHHHPMPAVRLTATESLAFLSPEDSIGLWTSALADPHPLVKEAAHAFLNQVDRGEPIDPSRSLSL